VTGQSFSGDDEPDDDPPEPPLAWELPEIAALAVLAVVGIVAAGGLAAGIGRAVAASDTGFPGSDSQVWLAVQIGGQWASPLIAALLLGVFGLCWWQVQAWSEVTDAPEDDDDVADALGHMGRAHRITLAARIAIVVTAAASIAAFVGTLGIYQGAAGPNWTIDLVVGASTVAVLVLLAAALWVGRRLQR
jgi:hypothetical protein